MREHGFEVEEHFHLPTAWRATYSYGQGGRTFGVNSEMDALPGIGMHRKGVAEMVLIILRSCLWSQLDSYHWSRYRPWPTSHNEAPRDPWKDHLIRHTRYDCFSDPP